MTWEKGLVARPAVFLATMGTEPQVVTIALRIILSRGLPPDLAVVVHTGDRIPAIREVISTLKEAFSTDPPREHHARASYASL